MFLPLFNFPPDATRIRSPPPAILTFPHEDIFFRSSFWIFAYFQPSMTAEKYRDILDCNVASNTYDFLYGGCKIECGSENIIRNYVQCNRDKLTPVEDLFTSAEVLGCYSKVILEVIIYIDLFKISFVKNVVA